jgi:pyruvate dehydrogenase E2 component (dihydrolipoamide acetyltransferase)
MPFFVNMPKLSPTMEEGTIAKWVAVENTEVKSGDTLIEVNTDKATVEFNALDDGFLKKILVQEGGSAKVNDPIAIFTKTSDESIEGFDVEKKPVEEKSSKEEETEISKESEKPKEDVSPKGVSGNIPKPKFAPAPPLDDYEYDFSSSIDDRIKASPLAKKIAKEKDLDLSSLKGSGPDGRIVEKDLNLAQKDTLVSFGDRKTPKYKSGSFDEENPSQMRKAIGKTLQQSKMFIPHFYMKQNINVDLLVDIREELKSAGIKVTYNDLVIRAVSLSLRENPNLNSGYDFQKEKIIRFKTVDIAVAVDIEDGLITPIIRYADYKNIGEIAIESKYLSQKAKGGLLKPEEYMGGSFTITNLGMMGIDEFFPIINPPQAAIIGVGGISSRVVSINDKIKSKKMMTITLACDHRIVDGAMAAKFMKDLQHLLENPALLIVK